MKLMPNPALADLHAYDRALGIDPLDGLRPPASRAPEPALREDDEARPAKPQRPLRTPRLETVRGWRQAGAA
jgi:hypothetical protein